jgi:geranylgeranyl pyrophosphate synthase
VPGDYSLDLIRANLLNTLGALDAPPSFSALLKIPLTQPDKVLGGAARPRWAQLVMAACAATSGDSAIGAQVAAAVEVFMAALDLLDEIEDGDASPTVDAAGSPQALNVSTALLLLSQRMLLDVPLRAELPTPIDFARTLTNSGLTATGGQHRDLASVGFATDSPDDVLETARLKAGALASAACRLGAMVGTADEALLELYGRWGAHYGTVAQLANDLHDALDTTEKSDIARRKSTMPLIFGHRAATDTGEALEFPESGALHFTWVVVEMERQACRELADQLESQGQQIVNLRQFVS